MVFYLFVVCDFLFTDPFFLFLGGLSGLLAAPFSAMSLLWRTLTHFGAVARALQLER